MESLLKSVRSKGHAAESQQWQTGQELVGIGDVDLFAQIARGWVEVGLTVTRIDDAEASLIQHVRPE